MPKTVLTDRAEAKITLAAGSDGHVAITHIALGDGLGANYAPAFDATALKREKVRLPIEKRHLIDTKSWRVVTEFGPETEAFAVREIGFFDEDGDLIALWAGLDVQARQTGVISYLVDHVLNFSRVEAGLVIIAAPDDDLFDHAVLNLETHAIIAREQFDQRQAIRALQAQSEI